MTKNQALKIAIRCMERRMQKIAFDKNMHDTYKDDNPTSTSRSKEWHDIDEAKELLERELNGE